MAAAIEIQGLMKRFKSPMGGELIAVNDLNLEVKEGEIFGFLGPNGAGKTTTIKILLGLLFPSAGKVKVLGSPAGDIEVKKRISYLPESPYFYEHMSVREILEFYASLFKLEKDVKKKRVDELLETVGLSEAADKQLRHYSKGMLQRVGIAQALLNDPDLVFLDEPTSGLDPIAHADICNLILDLRAQGKTVFVSSHQLGDIEMIANRVAILVGGKLAMMGDVKELLTTKQVEIIADKVDEQTVEKVKPLVDECELHAGRLTAYAQSEESLNPVIDLLLKSNAALVSVNPRRRTLEKLFVDTVRGGH
ncbi:MAG: ABC transporter ATP-binding protein [Armatimonadota bacterium]